MGAGLHGAAIPPLSRQLGGAGGFVPVFLLRDDFTIDAAAPLASPRTAEPGPGTLTITDTNSKLSVAGGKLVFATGGVGAGDPGAWGPVTTRAAGAAMVAEVIVTTASLYTGWDTNQASTIVDAVFLTGGSVLHARVNGVNVEMGTYSGSTSYKIAVMQRGTGMLYFIKGGAFASWTLLYVSITGSANAYAGLVAGATTAVFTSDFLRALQLPAPFTDDYGLATQRLAGAQSAPTAFVHEANCILEYVQTTLPTVGTTDFNFRIQDASNYWQLTTSLAGTLVLNEVVATVATARATVATVVAAGHRVVVIADASTIRVYSNNVLRATYASASNFATATAGSLAALGTTGAVADIVSWPRVVPSAAAALLDAAVA